MAGKIEVVEEIKQLRRVPSLDHPDVYWNCLDITIKGSQNAPKGLPLPSREIQYTVLINDKQLNKLKNEYSDQGAQILNSKVRVVGEVTLDLPLGVCEGEIGIIAYQVQAVLKESVNESQEPLKQIVSLNQILIPGTFEHSRPRTQKIKQVSEYIKQHQINEKPIATIVLESKQLYLRDGYVHYLAAKEHGLERIWIEEELFLEPKQIDGKYLWPLQQLEVPEKFLATQPRIQKIKDMMNEITSGADLENPVQTICLWNGLRVIVDSYIPYLAVQRSKYEYIWIHPPEKGQAVYVPVQNIRIPDAFLNNHPKQEKIDAAVSYLDQHDNIDKPIVVRIDTEHNIELTDRYTRYLALKEKNKQFAWVEICKDP